MQQTILFITGLERDTTGSEGNALEDRCTIRPLFFRYLPHLFCFHQPAENKRTRAIHGNPRIGTQLLKALWTNDGGIVAVGVRLEEFLGALHAVRLVLGRLLGRFRLLARSGCGCVV